ncbi:uncharacterized protein LOC110901356 [Helianthus annuus]|uniref:uncharacterized protein LOC110901356 n=1 Tax=Helianthus annuus TaxID=4232 RepID=UPI000B8EE9BD|nr:uncharacterized protein LOC110901356 [Helianthus annuus]
MELASRGINMQVLNCVRCGYVEESVDHLLAGCIMARSIWWHLFVWVKIPMPPNLNTLNDIFEVLKSAPGCKKWKKIVHIAAMATVWRIWNARNLRIFEGKSMTTSSIVELIKEDTYTWVSHRTNLPARPWNNWVNFDVASML